MLSIPTLFECAGVNLVCGGVLGANEAALVLHAKCGVKSALNRALDTRH